MLTICFLSGKFLYVCEISEIQNSYWGGIFTYLNQPHFCSAFIPIGMFPKPFASLSEWEASLTKQKLIH